MGVIQAHANDLEQLNSYTSINSINNFSIAEYIYKENSKTLNEFSHKHLEYEFLIPLKTIPLLVYDKANYIGEVGYIYPVNPNTVHGIVFPLDKSNCLSITIDIAYLNEIKESLGYKDKYFYTRFQLSNDLHSIINEYINEFKKESINQFKAESLAKFITTSLIDTGLSINIDNRRPEKVYRRNIKNIIQYMFLNYNDPNLDIKKLATMSGYSDAYFTKSFKAYMNDSPIVHLNKLRISEAKELLYTTNLSLTEIKDKVGYTNLSSFTEAFKRITGLTPTDYKNKIINKNT